MLVPHHILALAASWRRHGELLRQYGDTRMADVCELHAGDVERALREGNEETLSLTEAARESGFSAGHLGRLVRDGRLTNYGRPDAPRVARGELPVKTSPLTKSAPSDQLSRRRIARAVTNLET
jgi:hypothetical protein